ncbi:MAG: hypothetical protein U9O87_05910 [Verrucomicrobiota bacterium]|nr:hypothetical protein [Verrucomicrobiota bacterium]
MSKEYKFYCPHCNQKLYAEEGDYNTHAKCPRCSEDIYIPTPEIQNNNPLSTKEKLETVCRGIAELKENRRGKTIPPLSDELKDILTLLKIREKTQFRKKILETLSLDATRQLISVSSSLLNKKPYINIPRESYQVKNVKEGIQLFNNNLYAQSIVTLSANLPTELLPLSSLLLLMMNHMILGDMDAAKQILPIAERNIVLHDPLSRPMLSLLWLVKLFLESPEKVLGELIKSRKISETDNFIVIYKIIIASIYLSNKRISPIIEKAISYICEIKSFQLCENILAMLAIKKRVNMDEELLKSILKVAANCYIANKSQIDKEYDKLLFLSNALQDSKTESGWDYEKISDIVTAPANWPLNAIVEDKIERIHIFSSAEREKKIRTIHLQLLTVHIKAMKRDLDEQEEKQNFLKKEIGKYF